jgi:hypothetical protein
MSNTNQLKPLPPPPPHSNFFNPQLQPQVQSKFSAPAFRNPAFTTPQKRIDELQLSEMSGGETSPAMTEDSEMPDDTPEVDRYQADLGRMTVTPANRKLFNTATRTGTGKARSRTPGKGEISRGNRDIHSRGKIRKRTRQTGDRDVGSVRSRLPHDSDESDSEWEQDLNNGKTRRRQRTKQGAVGGFLSAITMNPDAPVILSRWVQFSLNFLLIGALLWCIWGGISMVRADLASATEKARADLLAEMQICSLEYTKNRCSPKAERLPALGKVCDEWEACMNQDPSSVMKVQVSAKNLAEVLNEFTSVLNAKAWVSFLGFRAPKLLRSCFVSLMPVDVAAFHTVLLFCGIPDHQHRLQQVPLHGRWSHAPPPTTTPFPIPAGRSAHAYLAHVTPRPESSVHLGAHQPDASTHPKRHSRQ